jgi:hypothetical protein
VVTISISEYTPDKPFSSTIIAKMEVPADILPVRTDTLFVATIPVPASPSGGQRGTPAFNFPVGSSNCAPFSVSTPAFSPAIKTLGSMAVRLCLKTLTGARRSNSASIRTS